MAPSVRVASPADAVAVAGILTDSYPSLMAPAYDAGLLARTLPAITRPNPALLASGRYFIAEAGGEAVGCGGWSLAEPGSRKVRPGIGHIRHFATREGWTGRGIGRLVYQSCEEQARAAGVRELLCFASRNGEGFYAALGFEPVGPIDVPMANGTLFPSIFMRRRI